MTKGIDFEVITNKILKWYSKNKHQYHWRKTKSLYKILITEILLQKTIAINVNNIYHEFFKKYNTFSKLFATNMEELQSDIKSLGLSNKRARTLKDLSEMVLNECNGEIPVEVEKLKEVNGIADYVSNAYLCFGLNKRSLFYDVNIKRIISRVFNKQDTKVKDNFISVKLENLLPRTDCKYFYWGILDLGNKICTKKSPKCESCPILVHCHLYSNR